MICARCGKNYRRNTASEIVLCHNSNMGRSGSCNGSHIGFGAYPMPASQVFVSDSMIQTCEPYNLCPDCQRELEDWFTQADRNT